MLPPPLNEFGELIAEVRKKGYQAGIKKSEIKFLAAIPVSPAGKVLKRELRETLKIS